MSTAYRQKPELNHETAMRMIGAACNRAEQFGIRVNIAIADSGGNLKAFMRMDDAPLLSSEIAQNKAYSAAAFGIPTSEWYPMIQGEPGLLHGIVHTNRLTIFAGGLPIRIEGSLAGGIGVSGGSAEQDEMCAQSALDLLKEILQNI